MSVRVWILVLVLAAGCPPAPLPTDAPGAYLRGRFSTLLGAGIEGVSVCADARCTTTDAQGRFVLEGLPEARDVTVHVDKEGYFPTDLPHHTLDSEPPWDKKLLGRELMQDQARRADAELLADRGHFSFMAHQEHFREGSVSQTEGVRIRVEPAAEGASTYYLTSPLQLADAELEATTSAGGGGAFNLPPGPYDVSFDGPGGACSRILSWDFAEGESVPVEIVAGRGTYIDILCPAAP